MIYVIYFLARKTALGLLSMLLLRINLYEEFGVGLWEFKSCLHL